MNGNHSIAHNAGTWIYSHYNFFRHKLTRFRVPKLLKNSRLLFIIQIIITGLIIIYASRHFDLFQFKTFHILPALMALLLIPVNIGIESAKFKTATGHIKQLSFKKIYKLHIHAINIGLLTPNRLGEGLYKIAVFEKNNRKKALKAILHCSIYQLMMTLLAGGLIFIFAGETVYKNMLNIFFAHQSFLIILALFVAVGGFAFIFYLFKKNKNTDLTVKNHLQLAVLSGIRYTIFVIQFYFILASLGASVDFMLAFYLVGFYFLVQNIIPSGILTDIPTRFAAATFVAFSFSFAPNIMIQAALSLYLMNAVLPALFGFGSLKKYKKYKIAFASQ